MSNLTRVRAHKRSLEKAFGVLETSRYVPDQDSALYLYGSAGEAEAFRKRAARNMDTNLYVRLPSEQTVELLRKAKKNVAPDVYLIPHQKVSLFVWEHRRDPFWK